METLNNIVLTIQDYLSNYILIVALVGGGIWFSIRTGFIQVRGFTEGLRRTFGGLFSKKGRMLKPLTFIVAVCPSFIAFRTSSSKMAFGISIRCTSPLISVPFYYNCLLRVE